MQKNYAKWIEYLYGPFFRVIGFFYRIYTANRRRLASFRNNTKVSSFLRFTAVLILLGWILVWFFASDESRTRLTDEIERSIGGIGSVLGQ